MEENIVTCSKCGERSIYKGETPTPDDVFQQTGYTWSIRCDFDSNDTIKTTKISEDMIWLCPDCNKDEDKEVGC